MPRFEDPTIIEPVTHPKPILCDCRPSQP